MEDKLFELIMGEEGLVVTLRCDNKLDEEKFSDIKAELQNLVIRWKKDSPISVKAMLAVVELVECLAGGSRFLKEEDAIRVEDASFEIRDILNELYEKIF